jgi:ribulose-5-phosphate 4-epimerase/fuculose-1-phosphate aldolase
MSVDTDSLALDPITHARRELAAAFRLAARAGWDDGLWNHFSLRIPGRPDRFLLKPHGLLFSEVTASQLVVVDGSGEVVEGVGEVEASALLLHARIYASHERVACALHVHPPYASTLTLLREERLRFLHQDALHFYGRVAYDDVYDGLALTPEQTRHMVEALGGADVLFLRHHGVIVVGTGVADAWYHLAYLELACRRQHLALATGRPLAEIPPQVARKAFEQFESERARSATLTFTALLRSLDRQEPEYAK